MDNTKNTDEGVPMIYFEKSRLLLLLVLVIPAVFFSLKKLFRINAAYSFAQHKKSILPFLIIRNILFAFAWIFIVLAAAGPLWGSKIKSVRRQGVSVVFAVDISKSMTLKDVKPSRLNLAKGFCEFLTVKLSNASCALLAVKGDSVLSVPLTFEHEVLLKAIESLSPSSYTASGTNLQKALLKAAAVFPKNRATAKTIILCTDGEQSEGNILEAAKEIQRHGIQLIIVGFGTIEGGDVSIVNEKGEAALHRSSLNETVLQEAVKVAANNSMYTSASVSGSAWVILEAINKTDLAMDKFTYIQKPVRRVFEFITIAIVLFCIALFIEGSICKK
ncbi:von Willebrand factor type A domain protein [Treponema phagedenis]|uniref:von Willebrand factor type A domain protein n=1 Tax=Treponema phagedenis TaxID=162 RepID=A0A0B7GQK1_TREPH|nr:von Willebrand factor type A domain protein [Treponema phagedenis]